MGIGESSGSQADAERSRFTLTGRSIALDRRINAIRGDLADIALAGWYFAPHYSCPQAFSVISPRTAIRAKGDAASTAVSELLYGEAFHAIDIAGGWAWGYSAHDNYVGYVRADLLSAPVEPTHIVTATAALVFAEDNIKSPERLRLPMGSRLAGEVEGAFLKCREGFIHLRHVSPVDSMQNDPVAIAQKLTGTPYLWGGRSSDGLDCSGLVQLCLSLCEIVAPRDTDQQMVALGEEIDAAAPLQRGDIIFFPGHVGFMSDADNLIHANAFWMQVMTEPLVDVVARLVPDHAQPVLARKRINL
ncbi:C40 family peptidase [Rhizorhapis sp. SPR117]|uniref:C40 family peptidase n=1 Tax=Rhizorhapis sp. SPR117 TaxID=2912611 RepID=UPI001F3BDA23|nr:NlpC/P60 family protein [Rhizorhapis sp. SPR117]